MILKLSTEQLKFAREIGATHWDCDSGRYRKDGYIYIPGFWRGGLLASRYHEYDDIIKIDFTPLDEEGGPGVEVKPTEAKKEVIVVYQDRIPEGCSVRVEKDEVVIEFNGKYYFTKTVTAYEKTMQAILLLAEAKEG